MGGRRERGGRQAPLKQNTATDFDKLQSSPSSCLERFARRILQICRESHAPCQTSGAFGGRRRCGRDQEGKRSAESNQLSREGLRFQSSRLDIGVTWDGLIESLRSPLAYTHARTRTIALPRACAHLHTHTSTHTHMLVVHALHATAPRPEPQNSILTTLKAKKTTPLRRKRCIC
jgi:hypothetical protein